MDPMVRIPVCTSLYVASYFCSCLTAPVPTNFSGAEILFHGTTLSFKPTSYRQFSWPKLSSPLVPFTLLTFFKSQPAIISCRSHPYHEIGMLKACADPPHILLIPGGICSSPIFPKAL